MKNSFVKNTMYGAHVRDKFYNMSIGRMVYLNGSDHDQKELVDADPNDIKIGFGDFFQTLLEKE